MERTAKIIRVLSRVSKAPTHKAKGSKKNVKGKLNGSMRKLATPLLPMIWPELVNNRVILNIRATKVNKARNQINLRFVLNAVIVKPMK